MIKRFIEQELAKVKVYGVVERLKDVYNFFFQ